MKDITGKIIYRCRVYRLELLCVFSTFLMKTSLAIRGVAYGRGLRFWGTAHVTRFPGSIIKIGDFSSFRSDRTSNLIGVNRKCIIATHSKTALISIGKNCGLSGTVIGAKEKIVIGNNVLCGANTLITDFDWHGIQPDKRRTTSGESKEVVIGDNVFIGYASVILKGVTIGDNSVIGANSVVTRSIPGNVIAGGNPCRVLKTLKGD
jgi:acetyltransferase-like isoleucine patch superfamily enzyme